MKGVKIDLEKFIESRKAGNTIYETAKILGIGERTAERFNRKIKDLITSEDQDIIKENVKLAKQKQKAQDLNRIANKSFREHARVENAVEELTKELIKLLEKHSLPKTLFKTKKIKPSKKIGSILHISDTHMNELVNLMENKYDFTVASQRLKKFVEDSKIYLKAKGVKDVCVSFTGDLINSDRRLDELLSQATNRSKALFLTVSIFEQMILDLAQDFNVSVVSVIGNESRMTKDIGWVEEIASDNYDYIVHHVLKLLFRNSPVKFYNGKATEQVVELVGNNVLLLHGNQLGSNKVEEKVQKIIGKYSSNDTKIDYVIFGHLHSSRCGDTYSRSASLVGANAYSSDCLQLIGRASQNLYIFHSNGNRDAIKIDLQNVDSIQGYPINKELEAYNAKSAEKAKNKEIIHKVVI